MFLSLRELSLAHILEASQHTRLVDGFEFRMARFHYGMADLFKKARSLLEKPLIIAWKGKIEKEALKFVLSLLPDYIDVDYRIDKTMLASLSKSFPSVKWILSYHNFDGTDRDLLSRLKVMKEKRADVYKIAVFANCSLDALRLAYFLKTQQDGKLTAIAMGENGQWIRVLSKALGSFMNYCCLPGQPVAIGQFCVDDLSMTYHYQRIHAKTALYALIGDPVSRSYSHITHNEIMRRYDLDAAYVKICINRSQLDEEILFLKALGFRGISVTAPLKCEIVSYIEDVPDRERKIGAVNTLLFEDQSHGRNTDGRAARYLLEERVDLDGASVLILGAGGVARAIGFELSNAGADVYVFNRGKERLQDFIADMGVREHKEGQSYDIVVQAATYFDPAGCNFTCSKIAFEVVSNPVMTDFVLKMKEEGCLIIYGYQMFALQGAMQLKWWFQDKIGEIEEIYLEIEKLFGGMKTRRVTKH